MATLAARPYVYSLRSTFMPLRTFLPAGTEEKDSVQSAIYLVRLTPVPTPSHTKTGGIQYEVGLLIRGYGNGVPEYNMIPYSAASYHGPTCKALAVPALPSHTYKHAAAKYYY